MKFLKLIPLLLPSIIFAQDKISNDELNRKLDLILSNLNSLEERVKKIESKSGQISKDLKKVEKKAEEAKTLSENKISLPQNEEEKNPSCRNLELNLKAKKQKLGEHGQKKKPGKV